MKPTPETDAAKNQILSDVSSMRIDGWNEAYHHMSIHAEKLERERNEARQIAEHYRAFWERVEAAIDDCPNGDPLPWVFKAQHGTPTT